MKRQRHYDGLQLKRVFGSKHRVIRAVLFLLISFGFMAYGICAVAAKEAKNTEKYVFTTDWFTHDVPTWTAQLQRFKGKPNIHYLEMGVFEGRSLLWMLDNILTHPSARATGIDIFLGDTKERFMSNLLKSGAPDKVTVIKGDSRVELRKLPFRSFDIIYIDASHVPKDVLSDAVLSWPLLKEDGLLIFDDYQFERDVQIPRVAIDPFMYIYRDEIEVIVINWQVVLKKVKPETKAKLIEKLKYGC